MRCSRITKIPRLILVLAVSDMVLQNTTNQSFSSFNSTAVEAGGVPKAIVFGR
jgi:hypothetical protein